MPKLIQIKTITATLKVETGLRIGGGDEGMHIGGVDNPIIKHPHTNEPYIPGSSIKGKMRSLLEWKSGAVQAQALSKSDYDNAQPSTKIQVLSILQLFGMGGSDKLTEDEALFFGPSRLAFWDCALNTVWKAEIERDGLPLTEVKSENRIDRIKGTAEHPRQTERVPAGAEFGFKLSFKILDTDDEQTLVSTVLSGLKLIELDSLGGSGSRGYGKVSFQDISVDGDNLSEKFATLQPFAQ
jgi:CRISPR-associated protein Csm3